MKLLRTINRLKDPRDLWLFLQILILLLQLPRRIKRESLPSLLASLDTGVSVINEGEDKLEKTRGFIDSLLRYRVFQRYGKCLLRSLVLFKFLRRQGWPVEVHFGVKKTEGDTPDLTGHSWLVLDGKPFLEHESQLDTFVTTLSYPR